MVISGLVFLISISACLLLVYRNTINFLMFTLYLMTLPNSLILGMSLDVLGFLGRLSCYVTVETVFPPLFLISVSVILFSCFIEPDRTLSPTLNTCGE